MGVLSRLADWLEVKVGDTPTLDAPPPGVNILIAASERDGALWTDVYRGDIRVERIVVNGPTASRKVEGLRLGSVYITTHALHAGIDERLLGVIDSNLVRSHQPPVVEVLG